MPLAFTSVAVKGGYKFPLNVGNLADSGTFFGWEGTFGSWVPVLFGGNLFASIGGGGGLVLSSEVNQPQA